MTAGVEPQPEWLPAGEPDGVRVRTNPGLCAGWGNCHRFASAVYPLDEEGMVAIHLAAVPAEHALEAFLGAAACPEHAITVIGPNERYWIERQRAERAAEIEAADAPKGEAHAHNR
ncbi:MAG: ferredoxin [Acidimicrobiia bacterium]